MTDQLEYCLDGFAFYSVSTPTVFAEFKLPKTGVLTGQDRKNYARLLELADLHKTPIVARQYRIG